MEVRKPCCIRDSVCILEESDFRATVLLLGTVSTGNNHRLDKVTRESEKSFQVCAVENFKDTLFCSICRKCKDPGELEPSPRPASSHSDTTPVPVQNLREEVTTLYEQRQSGDGRAKQQRWRVLQLLSAMKSRLRDTFLEADARRGRVQEQKDVVEAHQLQLQNLLREIRRCRGFST
ncbi:hypothetical protein PF003_g3913 [Phytophthora fragariae]|nr:hypothetical protein PF003_g3913 [Phytophthora fragariae]